jgi:hypothetical protein
MGPQRLTRDAGPRFRNLELHRISTFGRSRVRPEPYHVARAKLRFLLGQKHGCQRAAGTEDERAEDKAKTANKKKSGKNREPFWKIMRKKSVFFLGYPP